MFGMLALPMLEVKATGAANSGEFEGYASTRVLDRVRDIVMPGAFKASIERQASDGPLPLLWMHNPTMPIGSFQMHAEDEKGLPIKGQIDTDVQKGAEVYSGLKKGYITDLSIGWNPATSKTSRDLERKARLMHEIDVREVTLAPKGFAINQESIVTSVKAATASLNRYVSEYGDAGSDSANISVGLYAEEVAELIDALQALIGSGVLADLSAGTGVDPKGSGQDASGGESINSDRPASEKASSAPVAGAGNEVSTLATDNPDPEHVKRLVDLLTF